MLIKKKNIDECLGMLSDDLIYTVLKKYDVGKNWIVLPFLNINGTAIIFNRRSETAKKAILLINNEHFVLKEIPWYCANAHYVRYELLFQEYLYMQGLPIPEIIKTKKQKLFVSLENDKFFFLQRFKFGSSWKKNSAELINSAKALADIHLSSMLNSKELIGCYNPPQTTVFELSLKMLDVLNEVGLENSKFISQEDLRELEIFYKEKKDSIVSLEKSAIKKNYNDSFICIHGDYNPWNIIYDQSNYSVTGIVDFDNSVIDNPVHDVAEGILDFCFFVFKEQMTRFKSIPSGFQSENATLFLVNYMVTYRKRGVDLHFLEYFYESVIAVAIELFALGIVRGDFNLKDLNQINKSIELLKNEVSVVLNNIDKEFI